MAPIDRDPLPFQVDSSKDVLMFAFLFFHSATTERACIFPNFQAPPFISPELSTSFVHMPKLVSYKVVKPPISI